MAAFTPTRPEITATVHELGVISLVTTDQYVMFLFVSVAVICLLPNDVVNSPVPLVRLLQHLGRAHHRSRCTPL
jgi:hypothetical protein